MRRQYFCLVTQRSHLGRLLGTEEKLTIGWPARSRKRSLGSSRKLTQPSLLLVSKLVNVFLDYTVELLFRRYPYLGMEKLLVLFKGNSMLSLQITSYYSHVSKWRVTGRGTQGVNRKPFCAVTQALVLGHQVRHCHSVSLYLYGLMKTFVDLFQRHTLRAVPVSGVKYEWKDKNTRFWVGWITECTPETTPNSAVVVAL